MKTSKLFHILFIFLILLLAGCHVRKDVAVSQNTAIEQKTDIADNSEINRRVLSEQMLQMILEHLEIITEEKTQINLSAPDSTGKQHPTSITTIKRDIERQNKGSLNVNTKTNDSLQAVFTHTDKSKSKQKQTTQLKQHSEIKTITPAWVWIIGIVAILGALLFLSIKFKWISKIFK